MQRPQSRAARRPASRHELRGGMPYDREPMNTDAFRDCPPVPIPNSYWVLPGRLLAGEYPGSTSRGEAMERVRMLLDAGIDSFVDLTEEGELPAYESLLPGLTEQHVGYRRLPIVDHSIPESHAHMARIVDAIEAELGAGRRVYVHCHAGIGRTGMAMGCYLIRSGLPNDEALSRLQVLWRQCGRSQRWPTVPETREQIQFVRGWGDVSLVHSGGSAASLARYEGALVGLAIGDALGLMVSMSNFDAATLAAGLHEPGRLATGASTATAQALAQSLLERGAHDPEDQMHRYLQWMRASGTAVVPAELKRALAAWQWSGKPNAGSHDPRNLDAHTLPRTLAVALFMKDDPQGALDVAADASRTTQQSPIVLDLCRVWAALLIDAADGVSKATLTSLNGPAAQLLRKRMLKPAVKQLLERRSRELVQGDDALSVTRAALASFASAATFKDALLHVASSFRTAPAAAALCGALAGAHHGADGIPPEWRSQLAEDALLRSLARHLVG